VWADTVINQSNVRATGLTGDGKIIFKKDTSSTYSSQCDPIKPDGALSVFTPDQTIVYFNSISYIINDDIRNDITVTCDPDNDQQLIVKIKPFKNSMQNINLIAEDDGVITRTVSLLRPENGIMKNISKATFSICISGNIVQPIINKDDLTSNVYYGKEIATIEVIQTNSTTELYDTRQRGGGIVEGVEPNYDLMDVGNILGRPYRKAGTMIITLPKRLEQYRDIITQAVQSNVVAEELPIIIFE
jgi:hypothetical protein